MNIGSRDMSGGSNTVHFQGTQNNTFNNVYNNVGPQQSQQAQATSVIDRNQLLHLVHQYSHEDGWMCPLPWDPELRFPPEDYFIELDLNVYDRTGKHLKSKRVQVEDVFVPLEGCAAPMARVLVRGDAGFGKSTLCAKTVHDWSQKRTTFRAKPWDTTLPIFFRLRFLEPEEDLEERLFSQIKSFHSEEIDLIPYLKSLGENLLVILDGYDELHEEGQDKVKRFVSWDNRESLFNGASFLVTSRPITDRDFLKLFNKHFIIQNVSKEKVERIVAAFDANWPCPSRHQSGAEPFSVWQMLKSLVGGNGRLRTRLVEKHVQKQTGEKLKLKNLPPLVISLICWLLRQPDFNVTGKDKSIIYNCILLLSKRCNIRERFSFSEDEIEDLLWILGVNVGLSESKTRLEEWQLKCFFETKELRFLTLTGILKATGFEMEWQPVHKAFFDTLVKHVLSSNMKCLRDHQLLTRVLESENFHADRFFFTRGRLEWIPLDHRLKHITYDFQTKQLAFSRMFHYDTGTLVLMSGRCRQSINRLSESFCKCLLCFLHLRSSEKYYRGFDAIYELEDAEESNLEAMFCPHPQSVLTTFLKSCSSYSLTIKGYESVAIELVIKKVFKEVFGFSSGSRVSNETQDSFFRRAIHCIRRTHIADISVKKSFWDGSPLEIEITADQSEHEINEKLRNTEYNWRHISNFSISLQMRDFSVMYGEAP